MSDRSPSLPRSDVFSSDSSSPLLTRIVQGVLSVLGVYAMIRFLPRLVSSFFKRFVFGLVGEILLVTIGTLLTERLTRSSARRRSRRSTRPRPSSASPSATSSPQTDS